MDIIIANNSSIPLYEQLVSQIKQAILQDELKPDEPLPSIRMLAKELQVSIITVKRAYEDLEAEGYVTTIPGKGTYVSGTNKERLREARLSQIEEKLEGIVKDAKAIDLTMEELISRLELLYEEV
ncbi:MAG: GntR family transcriptional regulator [Cellulosilyticaceae bacterium]